MKRTIFVYALLAATAAVLAAQASQTSPYEGTSNPPPDDTITTPEPQPAPAPKPAPGKPANVQSAQQQPAAQPQQVPASRSQSNGAQSYQAQSYPAPAPGDGTDDGIVQVAPDTSAQPNLNQRAYMNDPDGDIVHPAPLGANELGREPSFAFAC